jgi:hypothetical protein
VHVAVVEYRERINEALMSRTEEILTRSIFARLDAAIMKCQVSQSPLAPESLIKSAELTYNEFDGFVWRFKLKHEPVNQITAKMERLRYAIEEARSLRLAKDRGED